jgi:hypothetical protein
MLLLKPDSTRRVDLRFIQQSINRLIAQLGAFPQLRVFFTYYFFTVDTACFK